MNQLPPHDPNDIPADRSTWRKHLFVVIFGSDTRAGKLFDVILFWLILASIVCVMLESVPSLREIYGVELLIAEWFFTVLFTIEYILRLIATARSLQYAKSFFGVIDLVSIIPSYLSLFVGGYQGLIVVRAVRLLRIFRIMKLVQYSGEAAVLSSALKASRHKITVFLFTILSLIVIMGTIMYMVEGPENGFTSIPASMYWSVVTLTTVGYGDITPVTTLGKVIASFVMLMGFGIIAVPTGIVSVEIGRASRQGMNGWVCEKCREIEHRSQAKFCFRCGSSLVVLEK